MTIVCREGIRSFASQVANGAGLLVIKDTKAPRRFQWLVQVHDYYRDTRGQLLHRTIHTLYAFPTKKEAVSACGEIRSLAAIMARQEVI